MTIEEIKEALDKIPADTAINRATRRALLARLYALMEAEGDG